MEKSYFISNRNVQRYLFTEQVSSNPVSQHCPATSPKKRAQLRATCHNQISSYKTDPCELHTSTKTRPQISQSQCSHILSCPHAHRTLVMLFPSPTKASLHQACCFQHCRDLATTSGEGYFITPPSAYIKDHLQARHSHRNPPACHHVCVLNASGLDGVKATSNSRNCAQGSCTHTGQPCFHNP